MARLWCRGAAGLLIALGLSGLAAPGLLGLHLGAGHVLLLVATGAVAAGLGWKGGDAACRAACALAMLLYALLAAGGVLLPGVVGLLLGEPGLSSQELAPDVVLHAVVAGTALVGALAGSRALTTHPA
jgi:hypothetical protein